MNIIRKHAVLLIVGTLLVSFATGCGRTPTSADDGTGGTGSTDVGNTGGGSVNPGGSTGGGIYNPTPVTPVVPVQISASVTAKTRTGTILLWWKRGVKATISLSNPSSQAVSGKVTVTFSKSGAQTETQDQPFSLAGGQTTTLDVTSTKPSDDAVATATTDSTGTGGSIGGTGSTGGGTSWPSTGSSF